jgi:hypothetical protein
VVLAGDHTGALILAQFEHLYRSSGRVDEYIAEEVERARAAGESVDLAPTRGWIRMDAERLAQEVMLSLTPTTMRRRLRPLLEAGWILERNDPRGWDRTKQYRFDPIRVARDLWKLGYVLAGWHFPPEVRALVYSTEETPANDQTANSQDANCKMQDRSGKNAGSYIEDQNSSSEGYDRSIDPRARSGDVGSRPKTRATAKPWRLFEAEVDGEPDGQPEGEAARVADGLVRLLDLRPERAAKLARYCAERGEDRMLVRVAERVAESRPRHRWPALLTAVLNARAEEGGGAHGMLPDDAAKRKEGYEWLFE